MNSFNFTGRLTADPVLKTVSNDISVCNFIVAIQRKLQKETTDYIPCVAWRSKADFVGKYFKKGSGIEISGEVQTDRYTDENGITRFKFEVKVDEVSFTINKPKGENTDNTQNPPLPEPPEY